MTSRTGRTGTIGRVMLVAAVAFGVMPILGANPAYACSCIETDEQTEYTEATHVFKGALTEGAPERTGDQDSGAGTVTYTFEVLDTYKGTVGDHQAVSTASQSATCGVTLDGTGPFLVFAQLAEEPAEEPAEETAEETPEGAAPPTDAPAGDAPATDAPATDAPAGEDPATDGTADEDPVLTMSLCGGTRPIGLHDQPTFGEAPDSAEPAGPTTPTAPDSPTTEPPAGEPPAVEPPAADQSTLALVVDKITGYLAAILEPLQPPAAP